MKNMRRAHDALRAVNTARCASCGEPTLPHHVCRHCGVYRGKQLAKGEE
jgi:large subunit ribosomal protein L32